MLRRFGRALASAILVLSVISADGAIAQALDPAPSPDTPPSDAFARCESIFSRDVCQGFEFRLETERAPRFEEDRLIVLPRSGDGTPPAFTDACWIAALIRETEALPNSRFMELRFEGITVRGMLHLNAVSPRARVSFVGVDFIPAPLGGAADPKVAAGDPESPSPPPECSDSEPLRSTFAGASIVVEGTDFRDRLRFDAITTYGSVIISASGFESSFDIVESDLGGDLVIESSEFAGNLELGHTIFRGQMVVDGVRVAGDMEIADIDVIDTYLSPDRIDTLIGQKIASLVDGDTAATEPIPIATGRSEPTATVDLTPACGCERPDGSFNIDLTALGPDAQDLDGKSGLETIRQACLRVANLPRCPRSNGSSPLLVEISQTNVGGLLNLTDLHFGSKDNGFRPQKSSSLRCEKEGIGCPSDDSAGAPSSLSRLRNSWVYLYDVDVAGAAQLRRNRGETLYINNSWFQRLTSEGNEFKGLIVARNAFGDFKSLGDKLYGWVTITRNDVDGSLELDSPILSDEVLTAKPRDQWQPWDRLSARVTHNRVGRDLAFTPNGIADGTIDVIDLSTNHVGGEMGISLPLAAPPPGAVRGPVPVAWSGPIELKSLEVDGTLQIRFAQPWKGGRMRVVDEAGALAEQGVTCRQRAPVPTEPDAASRQPRALVHLDLANSQARNLLWSVPLVEPAGSAAECVSWEGVGFRYDNWESDPGWAGSAQKARTAQNGDPARDPFDLWRDLYAQNGLAVEPAEGWLLPIVAWVIGDGSVPPDPLHHTADYFAKIGKQKQSQEVRGDAKRASYPVPAGTAWATLGNAVAQFIFLPTDFGTKPQRAFAILFYFTIFAWLVYWVCRLWYDKRWPTVQLRRDILVLRDRINEAMLEHLAGRDLDELRNDQGGHLDERRREEILDRYATVPHATYSVLHPPERIEGVMGLSPGELRHVSAVPGFMQYDRNRQPQDFNLLRYAIDTMIPVIDLHAYSQYYPKPMLGRGLAMLQHVVGWWVLTSALASLAVL